MKRAEVPTLPARTEVGRNALNLGCSLFATLLLMLGCRGAHFAGATEKPGIAIDDEEYGPTAGTDPVREPPVERSAASSSGLITRAIQLRYLRPRVNGRRAGDFAFLELLRQQLSKRGRLEYRAENNSVLVTDNAEAVDMIERVVHLLDFSGLPLPADIQHLPYKCEQGARPVPNLPVLPRPHR